MRISDWSSDVCSSDLCKPGREECGRGVRSCGGVDMSNPSTAGACAPAIASAAVEGRASGEASGKGEVSPVISGALGSAALSGVKGASDRNSVVQGTSVSVRLDHGWRRITKKKK